MSLNEHSIGASMQNLHIFSYGHGTSVDICRHLKTVRRSIDLGSYQLVRIMILAIFSFFFSLFLLLGAERKRSILCIRQSWLEIKSFWMKINAYFMPLILLLLFSHQGIDPGRAIPSWLSNPHWFFCRWVIWKIIRSALALLQVSRLGDYYIYIGAAIGESFGRLSDPHWHCSSRSEVHKFPSGTWIYMIAGYFETTGASSPVIMAKDLRMRRNFSYWEKMRKIFSHWDSHWEMRKMAQVDPVYR